MSGSNGNHPPLCGSRLKSGPGTCRKTAGWGTPHAGFGACRLHGGNMENHLIAAANHEARVLGAIVEMEPHDALLYCVHRAAGDVAWYERKLAELDEEAITGHPTSTVTTAERSGDDEKVSKRQHEHQLEAHILVRLRDNALDRLARYAKMAIDAGIEERQVRAAEQLSERFASVIEALFDALGTTPADRRRVLPVIQGRMLELERPAA